MTRSKTFIVIITILLYACTAPALAEGLPTFSAKKGVGGPGGCQDIPDLPVLLDDLDVSWFFNWAACPWPYWEVFGIEYVPMVRKSVDVATVALFPSGSYWLVGNEPDNKAQDDLTPMEAAEVYGQLVYTIISVDPDAKIILGGFSNLSQYTYEGYRAQLESAWLTRWGKSIRDAIVGWHGHSYSYQYGDETLQQAFWRLRRRIEHWIEAEPDMELWVTEFGNLRFADVQTLEWLTEFLEDTPGVNRYAFFYFGSPPPIDEEWRFTSCYVWPDLQMTELGRTYARLPNVPVPTLVDTQEPTSAPMVTPPPTVTPSPMVSPTETPYIVRLPILLEMTPASTQLELMQQHIILGVKLYNLVAVLVGAALVAGAATGLWAIKKR